MTPETPGPTAPEQEGVDASPQSTEMVLNAPAEREGGPLKFISRFGVLIAFAVVIALFAVLRTSTFLTGENFETILIQAAPLLIVALGLTVVLVSGDFDLSFGSIASIAGAIVIALMSKDNFNWGIAIILTLLITSAIGAFSGVAVAYFGASAFIITLAVGTAVTGFEFLVTDQRAIFTNIPASFTQIANGSVFGINTQIVIAIVAALIVYVFLSQSEIGRRLYAIGGNREAARLAGVPVARLRLAAFMITALMAGAGGILISSSNSAYTPGGAEGLLLPAYAAVFLGATAMKRGNFSAGGTVIGVLFLGVIQNGLILLGIESAWVNIVQGGILCAAVLSTRLSNR